MSTYELYHHGVKGMKWGVRKSKEERQAARVQKWKNKHIAKVEKRMTKETNKYQKKVDKSYNKLYDSINKNKPEGTVNLAALSTAKTNKAMHKYYEASATLKYKQALGKAEVNKIKNMSLSDIKAEKSAVGKAYVTSTASIAIAALGKAMGAPVVMYTVPNTKAIRTDHRVNKEQRKSIMDKAASSAARDLSNNVDRALRRERIDQKRKR